MKYALATIIVAAVLVGGYLAWEALRKPADAAGGAVGGGAPRTPATPAAPGTTQTQPGTVRIVIRPPTPPATPGAPAPYRGTRVGA